jgi:hypothetical protein
MIVLYILFLLIVRMYSGLEYLLGLDEDVVCGIVYIPPEYTVYSSVRF